MQVTPDCTADPVEAKLRAFVEGLLGGQVTAMQRLLRWRPAWNLELQRGDQTLQLHIRGERGGDVSPFPELAREADILTLLGEQGVPVPHIYGLCEDPKAIVMQRVPGSRDVRTAKDDAQRHDVARQWVQAMARMHQLPLQPFVEQGIELPRSAQDIALAGLHAYYPLYARNKTRAQPLAEFAVGWLRRHVPQHRTQPGFVQYDSGQFLFENGQVLGLYDFEFAMIGDPLADLASARMRDNYEPLGDSFAALYRHYQALTGEPADADVVRYHTVLFATVSTLQFSASVATPQPGDPHDTYVEFDLALRRVVVHALAEAMGVALEVPSLVIAERGPNAHLLTMLADALAHVEVASEFQQTKLAAASKLVEYLGCGDAMELQLRQQELQEAQTLLGRTFEDYSEIEPALEAFVKQAGPEHDVPLLRLFMAQVERRVRVYGNTAIGASARHIDLPPVA
ncbi:MAG: phosphotransferase family protein [Pseudomonas sp.]|uniref:phosphotransferase family protein n=1 Tax=Pseudomonas abieticivorans TaxID=2931382 RepID=UPI0020C08037|nr:phosphotransferase family protein [Pseudomonas sp. PIA16]MDE1164360.1 phosphotransferase family protein [Pseudomonas sp.]